MKLKLEQSLFLRFVFRVRCVSTDEEVQLLLNFCHVLELQNSPRTAYVMFEIVAWSENLHNLQTGCPSGP